jgi:hypothetical protein
MLTSVASTGIMANTTAPASEQSAAFTYYSSMTFISNLYRNVIYPTVLCPRPLLILIIRINLLRHQVATSILSAEEGQNRAAELVNQVWDFSADSWVRSDMPLQNLWVLAGQIFHSAVLLYCIASLHALILLPQTPRIRSMKTRQHTRLCELLPLGLSTPQLRPSMCWPLVVAGMHANRHSTALRSFVTAELGKMSCSTGIALPLVAATVLKTYWSSGNNGWDHCFNQPYIFTW